MIKLAILEDDALVRETLLGFLTRQPDIECIMAEESVPRFLQQAAAWIGAGKLAPDLVLTDIGLPGTSGIEAIPQVKKLFPETSMIIFSVHADTDHIFKALCAGAVGYLQKETPLDELLASIRQIYKGGSVMSPVIARKVMEYFAPRRIVNDPLTAKERQVVAAMVDGLSYKMIADRLGVSLETVRQHVKNIYRKLHVNSKGEVIARSIRGEI